MNRRALFQLFLGGISTAVVAPAAFARAVTNRRRYVGTYRDVPIYEVDALPPSAVVVTWTSDHPRAPLEFRAPPWADLYVPSDFAWHDLQK